MVLGRARKWAGQLETGVILARWLLSSLLSNVLLTVTGVKPYNRWCDRAGEVTPPTARLISSRSSLYIMRCKVLTILNTAGC